jgi:hypothetical protein
MYDELYQYLIHYKQLNVPGIGTFLLHRKPAGADFLNKCIHPPYYEIVLRQKDVFVSAIFFSRLASVLNISGGDAVLRFNDFAFDMKKQIIAGNEINWDGVGVLSNGSANEIKFTPSLNKFIVEESVPAEKVIREHAEHSVLVGESKRTSGEMTMLLNKPEMKRSNWWVYPLATGILIFMFIGWYFSEHSMKASSTSNQQPLIPKQAGSTYNDLR